MIDQSNRTSGNIMVPGAADYMTGSARDPSVSMGSCGYMLGDGSPGFPPGAMGPLASHAAMTSAMTSAYSAASAQHLSQYGRQQQQQHAAILGLSTPPSGAHMMGSHPTLPPHDYY